MALKLLSLSLLLAACLMPTSNTPALAREIPTKTSNPAADDLARLDDDSSGCWDALWEVKSCKTEIEAYFVNGTIDIGRECCQAITTITHHCWPAVLSAVGITPEESDLLRGYCDAESGDDDASSVAPLSSPLN